MQMHQDEKAGRRPSSSSDSQTSSTEGLASMTHAYGTRRYLTTQEQRQIYTCLGSEWPGRSRTKRKRYYDYAPRSRDHGPSMTNATDQIPIRDALASRQRDGEGTIRLTIKSLLKRIA